MKFAKAGQRLREEAKERRIVADPHPEAREEDIEAIRLAVNTINAYINDGRPLPPKGDPYYGADEAIDKILAALSRLAAQKDEGQWVNVKDELPKESEWVLCVHGAHRQFIARRVGKSWLDSDGLERDPLHWMPLPAAPEPRPAEDSVKRCISDPPDYRPSSCEKCSDAVCAIRSSEPDVQKEQS